MNKIKTIQIVIIPLLSAIIGGIIVNYFNSDRQTIIIQSNKDLPNDNKFASYANYSTGFSNFATGLGENSLIQAAKQSLDAVVHVKTLSKLYSGKNPFLDYFFKNKGQSEMPFTGFGSGVIISSDGYIVTNNHVIAETKNVEIVLNDQRSFTATLIGSDPATDIALLKISATDLPTLPFGNSEKLEIGEWVIAVGNPFNLTSTVTAGIVSAKARNINLINDKLALESFIQTDAAVNPGNSGGALVNQQGELVGINTAIASMTGYYTGYSFAIPVNIVQKIVTDLIEYGTVQRAYLGATLMDLNSQIIENMNISKIEGVLIDEITENGAASEAGLQAKDIILSIEDIKVNKIAELQEQIGKYKPGDEVKLLVKRADENFVVNLIFKNIKGGTFIIKTDLNQILGADFEVISETECNKLNISGGIKVKELAAGKLLKAGVEEGFIITEINRIAIKSLEDLQTQIDNATGAVLIKGIKTNGEVAYYAFGIN